MSVATRLNTERPRSETPNSPIQCVTPRWTQTDHQREKGAQPTRQRTAGRKVRFEGFGLLRGQNAGSTANKTKNSWGQPLSVCQNRPPEREGCTANKIFFLPSPLGFRQIDPHAIFACSMFALIVALECIGIHPAW